MLRLLAKIALSLCPWPLRRLLLVRFMGYKIHPTAVIGWSWVFPEMLVMGAQSQIGTLTLCKGLRLLELGEHSQIGRFTWITGFPQGDPGYFQGIQRDPKLVVGRHSSITNRHLIDCTDSITIGDFTTVGGFSSQLLTHSINFELNRQDCRPIRIGGYCFVGTNAVLLGGAVLPDYSILSAKSLLNKPLQESYWLYGGVPAAPLRTLPRDYGYFNRDSGVVH